MNQLRLFLIALLINLPIAQSSCIEEIPETKALIITGSPNETSFSRNNIKALIWNIKKTEHLSFNDEFKKIGTDMDLMLIQEALPFPSFNWTSNDFAHYHWALGGSFLLKDKHNLPTGTLISSKVSPTEIFVLQSQDREPFIKTRKSMTIGKYPLEGISDELLVISIHSLNFTKTKSFQRQINQAIDVIKDHTGPVIFAGDFNTRNFERLAFLNGQTAKAGLNAVKFNGENMKMKYKGFPLDHAFVRGITINKAEVISSPGSDHNPLIIEFDIH